MPRRPKPAKAAPPAGVAPATPKAAPKPERAAGCSAEQRTELKLLGTFASSDVVASALSMLRQNVAERWPTLTSNHLDAIMCGGEGRPYKGAPSAPALRAPRLSLASRVMPRSARVMYDGVGPDTLEITKYPAESSHGEVCGAAKVGPGNKLRRISGEWPLAKIQAAYAKGEDHVNLGRAAFAWEVMGHLAPQVALPPPIALPAAPPRPRQPDPDHPDWTPQFFLTDFGELKYEETLLDGDFVFLNPDSPFEAKEKRPVKWTVWRGPKDAHQGLAYPVLAAPWPSDPTAILATIMAETLEMLTKEGCEIRFWESLSGRLLARIPRDGIPAKRRRGVVTCQLVDAPSSASFALEFIRCTWESQSLGSLTPSSVHLARFFEAAWRLRQDIDSDLRSDAEEIPVKMWLLGRNMGCFFAHLHAEKTVKKYVSLRVLEANGKASGEERKQWPNYLARVQEFGRKYPNKLLADACRFAEQTHQVKAKSIRQVLERKGVTKDNWRTIQPE